MDKKLELTEFRIIRDNRIQHGERHFPQVRVRKKFLWKSYYIWKRISKHKYSFALYDHLDYPKSYNESSEIIKNYIDWINNEDQIMISHSFNIPLKSLS